MSRYADVDGATSPVTSLLYEIGILKDKQPNPEGFWNDRPIDDTGKQVEDGELVAIRCVLKRDPSFFDALGAMATMTRIQTDIKGVGDPNDLKGKGYWLTTDDYENDGGAWYTVVEGTADSAAPMVVRRVNGRFHLDLSGRHRVMANHGHWINSYETDDSYPANRNITCFPTQYGYRMQFQSSDRSVTKSHHINVKGDGDEVFFVFINLGHSDEARVEYSHY